MRTFFVSAIVAVISAQDVTKNASGTYSAWSSTYWEAIRLGMSGQPAGYELYGTFEVRVPVSTGLPEVVVTTKLGVPDAWGPNHAYSTYIQWYNFDMQATETTDSYSNTECGMIFSANTNTISSSSDLHVSCGSKDLSSSVEYYPQLSGNVAVNDSTCVNGWTLAEVPMAFTVDDYDHKWATCNYKRSFESTGMLTLKQGETIKFNPGFKHWSSPAGPSVNSVGYLIQEGEAPAMKWIVTDGSMALAATSALATLALVML